jgi:ABC-type dipeptide/oligopeptide/nickel transport system ATPase component
LKSATSSSVRRFCRARHVDLKVATGELLALLGPSGSGKTTLLRIIAGLDWPDTGSVIFDGEDALSRGAGERHVGFVFQHYALFRHMSVFENVAFGLRVQPRAIRKDEAHISEAREGIARPGAARLAGEPLSEPVVRRSAPAYRAGACAGHRAAHPVARRAVRCARCQGAQGTAALAAPLHDEITSPRFSSPTIRKRRSKSPIAWW